MHHSNQISLSEEFGTICRELGWKYTGQRFAVYSLMRNNTTHPTADMIREQLLEHYPAINRDSVFRIMNDFAEAGIFRRMHSAETVRFDANPAGHHHFFCNCCGMVYDFQVGWPLSCLPGTVDEIEVRGVCAACSKKTTET